MKKFSTGNPVLFMILLFTVSLIAAGVLTYVIAAVGFSPDTSSSIARLIIAALLLILYRNSFTKAKLFTGMKYALPGLIFAVWNLVYNTLSGASLKPLDGILAAVITAFAPGLFEEVIFRGIPFAKMKEKGMTPIAAVVTSALVFGLIHLTNIAGQDLANVLVQVCYAIAVGLIFGGIYASTGDFGSIVLLHALTDFTSHIFTDTPSSTPLPVVAVFIVMNTAAAVYGILLAKNTPVLEWKK